MGSFSDTESSNGRKATLECPCGFRGDPRRACVCSEGDVVRYRRKISGPLLDRIDLHVDVAPLPASDLRDGAEGEPSVAVRARVVAARAHQLSRTGDPRLLNASTPPRRFRAHAKPTPAASQLLEKAVDRLALSARAHQRLLRVARTIADLEGSPGIDVPHVAEALRYRPAPVESPYG